MSSAGKKKRPMLDLDITVQFWDKVLPQLIKLRENHLGKLAVFRQSNGDFVEWGESRIQLSEKYGADFAKLFCTIPIK
jgi:hypothetical protein